MLIIPPISPSVISKEIIDQAIEVLIPAFFESIEAITPAPLITFCEFFVAFGEMHNESIELALRPSHKDGQWSPLSTLSPLYTQPAVHTILTHLSVTFPSELSLGVYHEMTILTVISIVASSK